jgi:flagellar hook-length control protein FliK
MSSMHSTKTADASTAPLVSRQNSLEQPPATTAPTDVVNRGDRQLTEVERVRFVQRVSRAVQSSVDRGGEVRLRLSPPELGSLKVEIIVKQGVMNARLEAETPAARSLLLENLPMLRERLAEQNIRIDRFDVDLQGGFSNSLPDRTSDRHEAGLQGQHARQSGRKQSGGIEIGATQSQPLAARIARDGRLNVIV